MAYKTRKLAVDIQNKRRELYLALVCSQAQIKPCGYRMERYFEGDKIEKRNGRSIRSCKYDQYFKGSNPSKTTVKLIEEAVKGSYAFYYSPLWQAINLIGGVDSNYEQVYSMLSVEIINIIYDPKKNRLNQWQRKQLSSKKLEKLMIIGGLDTLACLIALRVENNKELMHFSTINLDRKIFQLLAHCCTNDLLDGIVEPLYLFLKQKVSQLNNVQYKGWSSSADDFLLIISQRKAMVNICLQAKLVTYIDDYPALLYWLEQGDAKLILDEIINFNTLINPRETASLAHEIQKGLVWFIDKINRNYSRSEKIDINKIIEAKKPADLSNS